MKKILGITWETIKELGAGIFKFIAYMALIAAIVIVVSSCQTRADKQTSQAYLMVLERIDQIEEKIDKLQDNQQEEMERIENELEMIRAEIEE